MIGNRNICPLTSLILTPAAQAKAFALFWHTVASTGATTC